MAEPRDPLVKARGLIDAIYSVLVFFNTVNTIQAPKGIIYLDGKTEAYTKCFLNAAQYEGVEYAVDETCPYEAKSHGSLITQLDKHANAVFLLSNDPLRRKIKGWLIRCRQSLRVLANEEPLPDDIVQKLNDIYSIPELLLPGMTSPIDDAAKIGNNSMLIEDDTPGLTILRNRCRVTGGPMVVNFFARSGIDKTLNKRTVDANLAIVEPGSSELEQAGKVMNELWREIIVAIVMFSGIVNGILTVTDRRTGEIHPYITVYGLLSHYHHEYWLDRYAKTLEKIIKQGLGDKNVYCMADCARISNWINVGNTVLQNIRVTDNTGLFPVLSTNKNQADTVFLQTLNRAYEAFIAKSINANQFFNTVVNQQPNRASTKNERNNAVVDYLTDTLEIVENNTLITDASVIALRLRETIYKPYYANKAIIGGAQSLKNQTLLDRSNSNTYLQTLCTAYTILVYILNEVIGDGNSTWTDQKKEFTKRVTRDYKFPASLLEKYTLVFPIGYSDVSLYMEDFIYNTLKHFRDADPGEDVDFDNFFMWPIVINVFKDSIANQCMYNAAGAYNAMIDGAYELSKKTALDNLPPEIIQYLTGTPQEGQIQVVPLLQPAPPSPPEQPEMGEEGTPMEEVPPPSPGGSPSPPSTPMEAVAATPGRDLQTHTAAAEATRVNDKAFRHPQDIGNGQMIQRYYKERPADQLVTAMLGTACVPDREGRRAPGCYEIPEGPYQTNLPCSTPGAAITGKCNFKTIPVPWENPVGNSAIYRVYQALDVGAQIKLQLQRAVIRYGYAAATIPLYCNRVLDRHFAMLKYDGTTDLFGEGTSTVVDLVRDPKVSMWTQADLGGRAGIVEPTESTNHNVAKLEIIPEPQNTDRETIEAMIRSGYTKFATTDPTPDERTKTNPGYLKRNLLPHYARILPRDPDHIPEDLAGALVESASSYVRDPSELRIAIAEKRNTFYPYQSQNPNESLPVGGYVPFPIFYAHEGHLPAIPNKAYLHDKYLGPENEGKRQLMLHRGSGMLLRAMQHLRNAMVLYVLASIKQLQSEGRWGPRGVPNAANLEAFNRTIANLTTSNGNALLTVMANTNPQIPVPRGAMAFLTQADKDVMIALFRGLMSARGMHNGTGMYYNVFDQLTDERDMRLQTSDGRSILAVGMPYKLDAEPSLTPPVGATEQQHQEYNARLTSFMTSYRRVVYLEALWSYWYDNNTMGKLRKRMNFRAKLARPEIAITSAATDMARVASIADEYQISAEILQPFGWADAALQGLVIMHVRAIRDVLNRPQPPEAPMVMEGEVL